MNQEHWILDTRLAGPVVQEVGFHGFLYGKAPADYATHVARQANLAPREFLLDLNGSFSGFVRLGDRILVFNDRYGHGKVYVSESVEGVVAGSSFNEVVRRVKRRTPDVIGILEFLRFGYPLHDRTFLKEVRVLPPGCCLEIDSSSGKRVQEERYWRYQFTENPSANADEMRERLWQTLEVAVEDSFASPSGMCAVGNSGGLDSRTILAIAQSKGFEFIAYTYGNPSSDAVQIARRIAETLRLQQTELEIKPDFLPKYYELHQERRPMITLASAWYYSGIHLLPGCTRNITGIYGDNTLGVHLIDKYLRMKNDWDLYEYHSLASDEYLSRLTHLPYDEVRAHYESIMRGYRQPDRIKRFDQWNFENRQARFIMEEAWVDFLGDMEPRCPFMHNELVDFALTLPFKLRRNRLLYQEAVAERCPEISRIRLERTPHAVSDPTWVRTGKSAVWMAVRGIERLTGWNPYFHGVHKHQREWMLSEPNLSFIVENIRKPSPLFADLFNETAIAANIHALLRENWSVVSNLLTIKLWLERFVGRTD